MKVAKYAGADRVDLSEDEEYGNCCLILATHQVLNRLEITSTGGVPQGLSQDEFFEGYSMPRNKELMRIFRDLEMVEYLGSGIPRISKA